MLNIMTGAALVAPLCFSVAASELNPDDLTSLPMADIYILGEIHDNPVHHKNQATLVTSIQPKALVFEMIGPEAAQLSQQVDRKDQAALDTALGWSEGAWPDFNMYFPIFAAAPDALVFGAALPSEQVRAAIETGAAAQFGPDAHLFGLDQPLPKSQQSEREDYQMAAHCNALPDAMLAGMVEAQRLRDAAFSRATLAAFEATGGPVVVITGNGHARSDWGMPVYLSAAAAELVIVSVGQLNEASELPPFERWIITPPSPDRSDPCAAFESN